MEDFEPTAQATSLRVVSGGPVVADPNMHRFDAAIGTVRAAIERGVPETHERKTAEAALRRAHDAALRHQLYVAWEELQRAQRLALTWYSEPELRLELAARWEEAQQKLSKWRLAHARHLVTGHLVEAPEGFVKAPLLDAVQRLSEMLDANSQNRHFRIMLVRQQLQFIGVMLAVTVGVLLLLSWKLSEHVWLLGALFGVAGALMSMALMLRDPPAGAIPEMRASHEISLLRPVLGAACGLMMAFLLQSTTGTESLTALFVGACFLSGFSERFFLSRLEAVVGETPKKE